MPKSDLNYQPKNTDDALIWKPPVSVDPQTQLFKHTKIFCHFNSVYDCRPSVTSTLNTNHSHTDIIPWRSSTISQAFPFNICITVIGESGFAFWSSLPHYNNVPQWPTMKMQTSHIAGLKNEQFCTRQCENARYTSWNKPSWLLSPVSTTWVDGWPVSMYPSTQAINSDSGNRALVCLKLGKRYV